MAFRIHIPKPEKSFRPLGGLLFVLALAGCGVIEDRTDNYVNAREGKPLKLPETADETRFSQVMPIRDVVSADSGRMYAGDIPRPPDMTSEILDENYVIEVVDDEIWLLVNDVPGRLWPAVTAYMNQQGLGVAYDNPQLGLLQSELVNYSKRARALLGLPDTAEGGESLQAVQAKVSPGVRRKTTEIQFRTFEPENGNPGQLVSWQENASRTPQQLETSRKLLAGLSEFLKAREDSKSYSRAALSMPVKPLVRLVSDGDAPREIVMDLDYGRAWGEVRRALDEAGIAVLDLNRDQGYFQVDFRSESEKETGWFFWSREDPDPVHSSDLTVEERDGRVVVTASPADGYSGEDRSGALLSEIFEYLY